MLGNISLTLKVDFIRKYNALSNSYMNHAMNNNIYDMYGALLIVNSLNNAIRCHLVVLSEVTMNIVKCNFMVLYQA